MIDHLDQIIPATRNTDAEVTGPNTGIVMTGIGGRGSTAGKTGNRADGTCRDHGRIHLAGATGITNDTRGEMTPPGGVGMRIGDEMTREAIGTGMREMTLVCPRQGDIPQQADMALDRTMLGKKKMSSLSGMGDLAGWTCRTDLPIPTGTATVMGNLGSTIGLDRPTDIPTAMATGTVITTALRTEMALPPHLWTLQSSLKSARRN